MDRTDGCILCVNWILICIAILIIALRSDYAVREIRKLEIRIEQLESENKHGME